MHSTRVQYTIYFCYEDGNTVQFTEIVVQYIWNKQKRYNMLRAGSICIIGDHWPFVTIIDHMWPSWSSIIVYHRHIHVHIAMWTVLST